MNGRASYNPHDKKRPTLTITIGPRPHVRTFGRRIPPLAEPLPAICSEGCRFQATLGACAAGCRLAATSDPELPTAPHAA